jgi:hypothetical protein
MEINNKVIRFPFQRHVNYANFMRKNKRLKMPTKPDTKQINTNNIYYLDDKN